MTTLGVTSICVLGVATALWIVFTGRHLSSSLPTLEPSTATVRERVLEGLRRAAAASAAGFVGGFLGFGLGGRLMMRVLAATSPDARGRITEAEEIVGDVTTGGTLFLVVFLAMGAAAAAALFLVVRQLLPRRTIVAGIVAAALGGGALARAIGLVDAGNRDFRLLGPAWLAVLLCVGVVVLGSLTIAVLVDRWVVRWPTPSWSVSGLAGLVPLAVFAVPFIAPLGVGLIVQALVTSRGQATNRWVRRVRGASAMAVHGLAVVGGVSVLVSGVQIVA